MWGPKKPRSGGHVMSTGALSFLMNYQILPPQTPASTAKRNKHFYLRLRWLFPVLPLLHLAAALWPPSARFRGFLGGSKGAATRLRIVARPVVVKGNGDDWFGLCGIKFPAKHNAKKGPPWLRHAIVPAIPKHSPIGWD